MFSPDGIDLGIVPEDISYVTNKDGTVISFVQARELWNYDQDEGKLSRVFSFLVMRMMTFEMNLISIRLRLFR